MEEVERPKYGCETLEHRHIGTQARPCAWNTGTSLCLEHTNKLLYTYPKVFSASNSHLTPCYAPSALKGLKTYLRSTMTEERISSLALLHTHGDDVIDFDEVIKVQESGKCY